MASNIKLTNAHGKTVSIVGDDNITQDITYNLSKNMYTVDTVAALRSMTSVPEYVYASGYHTKNDGAFGSHFYRLATDTGQVDNGGTIIRTVNGVYELQYSEAVNVKWFGAKSTLEGGYDDFDSVSAIQGALDTAYSSEVYFPAGRYKISVPLVVDSNRHQTLTGVDGGNVSGAGWSWISPHSTFTGECLLTNTTYLTKQDPQRINLKGLFFQGNNVVSSCVELSQLAGGTISNCTFVNAKQYGLKVVGKTSTDFIHNIYVSNCYVRMPNDQNLINPTEYPIYAAYYFEGGFHSINKCSSDGGRIGILLGAGDTDEITSRNLVSECHFEGWMDVGIKVHSLNQYNQK